jgi:hypothetical protein
MAKNQLTAEEEAAAKAEADRAAAEQAAADAAAAEAGKPGKAAAAPHGMVPMRHKDKKASASYDGVNYPAGPDGKVLVPQAAVESLKPHGFEVDV